MWWDNLGWLPDTHPAALSLLLFRGAGGGNRMKKLVDLKERQGNKDTYELLSWTKQT